MNRTTLIIGILILLLSCSKSNNENSLDSYLKENYEIDWNKTDSILIEKQPIFYSKDNPIKIDTIKVDLIEKKTNCKFYKMKMQTGYMEYLEIEIIVAVPTSIKEKITDLKSPTFTSASPKFLKLFEQLDFKSEDEKIKAIEEISYLFEVITYNGKIKNIRKDQNNYISELWHGKLQWWNLNFEFVEDKLVKLEILNPRTSFTEINN